MSAIRSIGAVLGIETLFIIILSLLPSLLSLLVVRKAKQRMQARLREARSVSLYRQQWASRLSYTNEALEPKPFVGDLSCQFNARSPYLRCAVNPTGPCENCSHYQQKG